MGLVACRGNPRPRISRQPIVPITVETVGGGKLVYRAEARYGSVYFRVIEVDGTRVEVKDL